MKTLQIKAYQYEELSDEAKAVAQYVLCTTGTLRKPSKRQALAILGFSPDSEIMEEVKEATEACNAAAHMIGTLLPLAGKLHSLDGVKLASVKEETAWHRGTSHITSFLHEARKNAVAAIVEAHKLGGPIGETALFTVNWKGERESLNKGLCVDFLRAIGRKGLSKMKAPEIYGETLKAFRVAEFKALEEILPSIDEDEGEGGPIEASATDGNIVSMEAAFESAKPDSKGKNKGKGKAA